MRERVRMEVSRRHALETERATRLSAWPGGNRPGPFKLMYFPTNVCNLRCAICWQRKGVHDYAELRPEVQKALIEDAVALGVRELVIGGGGEPLIRWSQLRPLIQAARAAGLYGMLFTNGTLITQEVAEALVGMGWNKVLVSLDGLENVTDEVREPGTFGRIVQGLDRLLAARGDFPTPVVGIGCVMTRQGVRDLPAFVRFLAERGCDQLNLIRLVVHLDSQSRFAVRPEELGSFQQTLLSAQKIADDAGMVTNLADYMDADIVAQTQAFEGVLLSDRTRAGKADPFWGALCFEPFSNIVVHANGMVGPCCMSGDDPVASVAARSLADVWFGEEFTWLRQGILSRRPESYCKGCDLNVFAENQRLRVIGKLL